MKLIVHLVALGFLASACGTAAAPPADADSGPPSTDANDVAVTDSHFIIDAGVTDALASHDASTTDVVIPHDVGACAQLAAPGMWETINPPDIILPGLPNYPYGMAGFVLDPNNAGTMYLGVSKQGLWKTTDCGATWTHANTGTAGPICGWTNETCSRLLDDAQWWSLQIDPIDSRILYGVNGNGTYSSGVFKSTDGGADWSHIWPPENAPANQYAGAPDFVAGLALDPADNQHLLVEFHDNCSAPHTALCLAETMDGGATYRIVDGNTSMGTYHAHDSRFYLVDRTTWIFGTTGGLWRTADAGATWTMVSDLVFHGALIHSNGVYYMGGAQGILRSPDTITWSLVPNTGMLLGGMATDGTTIFASTDASGIEWGTDLQLYESSPVTDGQTWARFMSPGMTQGALQLGYESDHHVLYSSNAGAGLFRVRLH